MTRNILNGPPNAGPADSIAARPPSTAVNVAGNLVPTGSYSLGSTAKRWQEVFTNTISASVISPTVSSVTVAGMPIQSGAPTMPRAHVHNSAVIPIVNGPNVQLFFDSESYDTHNFHSTATNTQRITIPSPGLYLFTVSVVWDVNGTGNRRLVVRKNADQVNEWGVTTTPDSVNTCRQVLSFTDLATTNDYYIAWVWQGSSGSLNVLAGTRMTFIQVTKISN